MAKPVRIMLPSPKLRNKCERLLKAAGKITTRGMKLKVPIAVERVKITTMKTIVKLPNEARNQQIAAIIQSSFINP